MIQTSDVKAYLRIDYADDDNFIADIIQTGYDYLADAIENFSELYAGDEVFSRKADIKCLGTVREHHRIFMFIITEFGIYLDMVLISDGGNNILRFRNGFLQSDDSIPLHSSCIC